MIPTWLAFTFSAAFFQAWRTALQQRLRGRFSVGTASIVRYLYAIPFGAAALALYCHLRGEALPPPTLGFALGCAIGGLGQVIGTALMITAFGHRNFVVGTAYSKTDAVQAAIVAAVVLHEQLSLLAWLGIGLGLSGVLTLSLAGKVGAGGLLRATMQPAALCGLGAGTGLAVAGIGIKAATEALGPGDKVLEALFALVVTNVLQTVMQGGWMLLTDRPALADALRVWRQAWLVGALSASGSASWFAGFALAPVALVRTVGQVEMFFILAFGRFYLRESLMLAELAGLGLIVAGVVVVLLGH